jgi:PAS domain-containing protein
MHPDSSPTAFRRPLPGDSIDSRTFSGSVLGTTDLSGWQVAVEEFLGVVLESVAQPVWVVDHHGLIRYANPAAVTALGYDEVGELLNRTSHERSTIDIRTALLSRRRTAPCCCRA